MSIALLLTTFAGLAITRTGAVPSTVVPSTVVFSTVTGQSRGMRDSIIAAEGDDVAGLRSMRPVFSWLAGR